MDIDNLFKYALIGWLLMLLCLVVFIDTKSKIANGAIRLLSWFYSIPLTIAILKSFNLMGQLS